MNSAIVSTKSLTAKPFRVEHNVNFAADRSLRCHLWLENEMTITIDNYIEPAGIGHREAPATSNSDSVHRAEATAADAELGAASTIISGAQNGSALTSARADLQQSIEQLIEAEAALARARQPVARLRVLVEDLGRAEQDLVSQRARAVLGHEDLFPRRLNARCPFS
jgi:hypothetical protein